MSTISFLNIAMHGRVNPTLPVVTELVRRGHTVTYHTPPPFADEIRATGATVFVYDGPDRPLPEPPTPWGLVGFLSAMTSDVISGVIRDLRQVRPDLIVHDSACPWGALAARDLDIMAVSTFTTFAFGAATRSPTNPAGVLGAALTDPQGLFSHLKARWRLHGHNTRSLPFFDLGNIRESLNLVFTSPEFQPHAELFPSSYQFVGPSTGARPLDKTFPLDELHDPVVYLSLGTIFRADPSLLRQLALDLAPLGGTVVVSTGPTEPARLGSLPANVLARRSVPQLEVLARAALFVTHGGMNSANEALDHGVPMVVIPQGADQPLVAARVAELGAGLALSPSALAEGALAGAARRLLTEDHFRAAASDLSVAQQSAGGYLRAADELERPLSAVG